MKAATPELVLSRDFVGLVDDHHVKVRLTRHQPQPKFLLYGGC